MPVYLLTIHAYRSWSEDHPQGYVQRGEGLKAPDPRRARWRAEHAGHSPVRFGSGQQAALHEVTGAIAAERGLRLHACATTPTHVHPLISFQSPACTCGASRHCRRGCPARAWAEAFMVRLKRKLGQRLAKDAETKGRPYLSRGGDFTPVRGRGHFDHLVGEYLPRHESEQAGIFRAYPEPPTKPR